MLYMFTVLLIHVMKQHRISMQRYIKKLLSITNISQLSCQFKPEQMSLNSASTEGHANFIQHASCATLTFLTHWDKFSPFTPKKVWIPKDKCKAPRPVCKKCRTPRLKRTHKTETLRLIIQDFKTEAKFFETHVFPGTIRHSYKEDSRHFIQNYSGH